MRRFKFIVPILGLLFFSFTAQAADCNKQLNKLRKKIAKQEKKIEKAERKYAKKEAKAAKKKAKILAKANCKPKKIAKADTRYAKILARACKHKQRKISRAVAKEERYLGEIGVNSEIVSVPVERIIEECPEPECTEAKPCFKKVKVCVKKGKGGICKATAWKTVPNTGLYGYDPNSKADMLINEAANQDWFSADAMSLLSEEVKENLLTTLSTKFGKTKEEVEELMYMSDDEITQLTSGEQVLAKKVRGAMILEASKSKIEFANTKVTQAKADLQKGVENGSIQESEASSRQAAIETAELKLSEYKEAISEFRYFIDSIE